MSHGSQYYLYGVISANGEPSFGPIGIGGRGDEVRAVVYRDIAAVASPCPPLSFQTSDPQQTLQRLAEHQAVLERVMAASTVLPVKFGTWVRDKAEIEAVLRGGYCNLRAALDRFDESIELDVVATWPDLAVVLKEIAADPEICKLKAELQQGPPVSAEQCAQLGQLVKSRLDARREKLSAEILAELNTVTEDSSVNELKDDSMIVNAAFLITRREEKEFDRKIQELDRRYEGKLLFRCVGPLPAYSFATTQIDRLEADGLDAARKTLELPEMAGFAQIKEAHRRLLRAAHPDNHPDDPEADGRLKAVSEAYRLLEQYCQHVPHRLGGTEARDLCVVQIRRLAELREELSRPAGDPPSAPGVRPKRENRRETLTASC